MSKEIKKPFNVNVRLLAIIAFILAPISIFFYSALTQSDLLELSIKFPFIIAFVVAFVLIMATHGQKPLWLIAPISVLLAYYFITDWAKMVTFFPENIVMAFLGFAASCMTVVTLISFLLIAIGKIPSRKPYLILMVLAFGLVFLSGLANLAFDFDVFSIWAWADQCLLFAGLILITLQFPVNESVSLDRQGKRTLKELEASYRAGVLTDEEFQAKKAALLK
jgi:hypothetical protein